MPTPQDLQFGRIAIKNRLVDETKVQQCLRALDRDGNGKSLGRFMVEKGLISPGQFKAIATRVQKNSPAAESPKGRSAASPKGRSTAKSATKPTSRTKSSGPALTPGSPKPLGPMITIETVEGADYSKLSGQPIDAYLKEARRMGASDLHFQVDAPPFVRLHGSVVYLKHPKLTAEYTQPRIFEILDEAGREQVEKVHDYDFCYVSDHGRYRANVLRQRKGYDAVFRVIPDHVPTLDELHLPPVLEKFTMYRQGIVLVTGPAGSGKTATLAALVDMINTEQHDHIVTVEDPIEFVLPSKSCNVNQRQVHRDTETYTAALRSAMRSDPDYIVVGEMRDLDTVSMAITAAETGHLVFATLHTTNSIRSVDRIIDIFPPKEQEQIRAMVSESLRGVISQKLLPRADGLGREPAVEVLLGTPAVGNMVREKKTFQLTSVLQTGANLGMVTMDDSILSMLRKKIITKETALFHAENKDHIKRGTSRS